MILRVGRALGTALLLCLAARPPARAAEEEPPPAALVFRWERLPGAVAYSIEISESRAFDKLVVQERVSENFYRWATPGSRACFWRVRGIDATGREGEYSEVRFVGKVVNPPRLLEPDPGATVRPGTAGVKLRWQRSDFLRTYVAEISPDEAFASPTRLEVHARQAYFHPGDTGGTFWWRVGGIDLNGDRVAPGEPRSFVVPATRTGGGRFSLGAAAGLFDDLQGDPGPLLAMEGSWALTARLSLALETGLYSTTPRVSAAPLPGNVSSRLYGVPTRLTVRLAAAPLGWVTPYAGIGLELATRMAQVGTTPASNRTAWEPGAALQGGLESAPGPARAFLQLSAVLAPEPVGFVAVRGGGVAVSAGFRIAVW